MRSAFRRLRWVAALLLAGCGPGFPTLLEPGAPGLPLEFELERLVSTPEMQPPLADRVALSQPRGQPIFEVEVIFLVVSPRAAQHLLGRPDDDPAAVEVDPVRVGRYLEEARSGTGFQVLRAPRLTVGQSAWGTVRVSHQERFLSDYEIEIRRMRSEAEPIDDPVTNGIDLRVRVRTAGERAERPLDIDIDLAIVRFAGLEFQTISADRGAAVTVELPVFQRRRLRATADLPDRGAVLIHGLAAAPFGVWGSGDRLIVVVSVRKIVA